MLSKSSIIRIITTGLGIILVLLGLGRLAFVIPPLDWLSHFPATALIGSTVLTICLAFLGAWMRCWLGLAAITLSLVLLIGPYMGDRSATRNMSPNLVVAMANVLVSNDRLEEILEQLPDSDVLALIETSTSWKDRLDSITSRWPFQWSDLRDNPFGLTVLTREQVDSSSWIKMIPGGYPAFRCDIRIDDNPVTIIVVHAMSPQSMSMLRTRDEQFNMLSGMIQKIPGNVILIGDLNASPWSASLLNLMHETGLRNSRSNMGLAGIRSGTWPTQAPALMRLPIDHCLVRGNITPLRTTTFEVPGADHLGLRVELRIEDEPPSSTDTIGDERSRIHPWAMFWRTDAIGTSDGLP